MKKNLFNITKCRFIFSVQNVSQIPNTNIPHIVFIGKSNVGKSSLINYISGENKLTQIAKKPGKTTHINFYLAYIEEKKPHHIKKKKIYIIDFPGYGYAKINHSSKRKIEKLIKMYLGDNKQCLILHLINICSNNTDLDHYINKYISKTKINSIIITKIDQLKKIKIKQKINAIKRQFCFNRKIFLTSSINQVGKNELLSHINAFTNEL